MATGPTEVGEKTQKSKIVPLTDENIAICKRFCGVCPTHDSCDKSEFLFCSAGASVKKENVTQRGCYCPDCEVWENYNLSQMYFCIQGEA